ncbi:hypothetical protein, partial [Enterococcus cecorum]|uniref:hypothetical protein n=2 Tax=Enterococcus cecorum TaxID=44008 RepID=UPI002ACA19D9
FNESLLDLETLEICEEESFYTRKNGKQKNQRNENVDEKLLKTFSQSQSKCNRWLYQLCKGYASGQVHPCTAPTTCSYISVD